MAVETEHRVNTRRAERYDRRYSDGESGDRGNTEGMHRRTLGFL